MIYVGEQAGRAHFEASGLAPQHLPDGDIPKEAVLIAGPGCGKEVAGHEGGT